MKQPYEFRKLALLPIAGRLGSGGKQQFRVPQGFTSLKAAPDQIRFLNETAVETFIELANAGVSFADCLGAVLLTGMHFATASLNKENRT